MRREPVTPDVLHDEILKAIAARGGVRTYPRHTIIIHEGERADTFFIILSGKVKGLAVTGVQRSQAAPEIPALAETLSGYEAASWYGIVVPARTPHAVIARLHTDIAKTLQQSDVRQRFLSLGGDIVSGGPEDLVKTMRGGTEKWGKLVKEIDARGR